MSDTNDFIVWANSAVTEANESRPLSEILLPNEKGFLLLCRCDAERVSARAEALEDRAALAEARLEALWTMDRERWNAGLYLQEFNTVEDLADALRARALGCNVDELPEKVKP